MRHGLSAEIVIAALEDAEDYKAFEATITADYDAQSAVERELVLRLAGLLWRLRRATTIETGLFEIQVEHQGEDYKGRPSCSDVAPDCACAPWPAISSTDHDAPTLSATAELETADPGKTRIAVRPANPSVDLAGSFLRLANLSNCALDRLSRYEAALWRQVGQTLVTLDALDRRKPQERGGVRRMVSRQRPFCFGDES